MLGTSQRGLLLRRCLAVQLTVECNSRCCWPLLQLCSAPKYRNNYKQHSHKAAVASVRLFGTFKVLCAAPHIKHPRKTEDGVRTVPAPYTRCPPTPFYGIHKRQKHGLGFRVHVNPDPVELGAGAQHEQGSPTAPAGQHSCTGQTTVAATTHTM
jgi:hypothetical protein